jgi:hypothetical protein
MAHDPHPYLATAAIQALAHFGSAEVASTLLDVARRGPVPALRAAHAALEIVRIREQDPG